MKILKFGGTSVGSPERIKNVLSIIKEKFDQSPHLVAVFSAFTGVTDELIRISHQASQANFQYLQAWQQLQNRHLEAAEYLIPSTTLPLVQEQLQLLFKELHNALQGISLIKELSKRSLDFILSFGERLSAFLINEALKFLIPSACYLDARDVIKTDRQFGSAHVQEAATYDLIRHRVANSSLSIVTGFIGSTDQQETTTLGRGGSDYTAALFGAALNAHEIEIWTDVDGVLTADPRKVPQAHLIPQMTFKEALEMSHFGAKVIHPPTIAPALRKQIPIRIKNSFNPQATGTFISHQPQKHTTAICGISSIDHVVLIRVEGSGLIGVCGIAARLFDALARQAINVILISQGSSEHSICLAIAPQYAQQAQQAIEKEFFLEKQAGLLDPVIVEDNLSILAIVGEQMRHTPGIAGKVFGALGKQGINVVTIAQGSSEYNISVVIKRADEKKALNIIHNEFFYPDQTTLHLFIVGVGLIGKTLLAQIQQQIAILQQDHHLTIKLVGLANSQKMILDAEGISLPEWQECLEQASEKMCISAYVERMKALNCAHSVFVDCTASEEISQIYADLLESFISIVTANKKANSGKYQDYQRLKHLSRRKGVKYMYETNVGAGLPIINTLHHLMNSGDKILKIEAILSGTLSYLFNAFAKGQNFSHALREAQAKGFTEPDPREDLNGKDAKRKLLILARECGYPLEWEQVQSEPLIPETCLAAVNVEAFFHQLEQLDSLWNQRREAVARKGQVLRYMAKLEEGQASLGLQAICADHPFFHLSGSDNIIAITTERYQETPLVIKGAGAGAAVTAGEMLANIIKII